MRHATVRSISSTVAAIWLVLAACSGPAEPETAPTVTLDGETVEMVEWRVRNGTLDCSAAGFSPAVAVDVRFAVGTTSRGDDVVVVQPLTDWDGDLLTFAHGYRDPAEAAGFWPDLPTTLEELQADLAAGDGASGVAAILPLAVCPIETSIIAGIDKGSVAFAASSYSENGFALNVAPFETRAAAAWFDELLTPASRRVLAGASLGGAVTVAVAEQAPNAFDAGLPMCGPVDGTLLQVDYVGHAELAFRTLYPDAFDGGSAPTDLDTPVDELAGIPFDGDGDTVVARIEAALRSDGDVDVTLGGYEVERGGVTYDLIPYDPVDSETLIDAFKQVFYFATAGKRDLTARVGGVPFDNQGATYRAGDGTVVSLLDVVADETVRANAEALFSPTGTPGMPLRLLHNEWDPVVPAFHTEAYEASAAAGADVSARIVTDDSPYASDAFGTFASGGYGHCRFPIETLQTFVALTQP